MVRDIYFEILFLYRDLISNTFHLKEFFDRKINPLSKKKKINKVFDCISRSFIGQANVLEELKHEIILRSIGVRTNRKFSTPECYVVSGDESSGKSLFCELLEDSLQKHGINVLSYNGIHFSDNFSPHKIASSQGNNTSICEKIVITPNSVLIIDDFHKIDKTAVPIFNQILKEGKIQMNNGDVADFSNCKIFLTSCLSHTTNLGFNIERSRNDNPLIDKDIYSLIKNSFSYHENWEKAWKDPQPKKEYDAVIIGGGGHGLATAYYMAKKHNMKNIAVVEKGWIGGGNTGRNTTIIRSNYLWDASAGLYDHALKIWEGLSQELNYNVMFSQRGVMNLAHNLQDVRDLKRRTHANRLNGIDAVYLNTEQVKKFCPIINTSPDIRYPVLGGTLQRRAGTARHDAVAWGYARGADEMGVDIIQNCEVKGIRRIGDAVEGIETTKGYIKTKKIGVVAAGHSSVIANMAGLRLPLESKPLQALVSEPVKPIIDTVVMSNAVHAYVSQSDKGELVIGAGTDDYVSYSQKGSHDIVEGTLNAILELYPIFSRMRMLRQWGGIVDICPDASPILSKTPIKGLYFNCGWGTGGFKATPGSGDLFAHTIANDEPHKLNAAFNLNRFVSGDLVDEHGAAAVAH